MYILFCMYPVDCEKYYSFFGARARFRYSLFLAKRGSARKELKHAAQSLAQSRMHREYLFKPRIWAKSIVTFSRWHKTKNERKQLSKCWDKKNKTQPPG